MVFHEVLVVLVMLCAVHVHKCIMATLCETNLTHQQILPTQYTSHNFYHNKGVLACHSYAYSC